MIGGGGGRGSGRGGASPSSSNSGGQFLLQLLQKPQPQPQTHPNPHQDPAVAAMGPSLPFQSNGHDHSPQPWVNQPCLPHEFFPPPPSPWPIPVPHPSSSQFPVFPEDFQRLGLLGNGKPPTLHHHHHNSNRRPLDDPEIGFNSSQNHPEFDRQLNSRNTSHYAPHELIRGAGRGEGWGRKEEPVQPVHHAPPPGFHHKHKGLQHNVDRELGSWDHSPNNNDHMLRNHGNGSSRLGLTRQLDHPGPPMGSKLHSVPASLIEESLANLQRQAVEQEIKHRSERQGNWNMGGRPGQDDLADKFMETVVLRDRFEKKNGVTNYNDFRDKDLTSKEFRELSAPGQRMRNHRRVVGCRSDLDRMNAPFLKIYESLVPLEEEKTKQKQLLTLLEKLVNKEWPKAELYLYGSCANSFGVSNSDIDVCLSIKDLDISKSELLLKLADILQSDNLENVQALTRARVPIVKLMDPATGISCDICINNVLAVVNTKLLRDYAQIDGRLRQLAFIVKHWAKSRGVNVTYQGTLSSYAYVLMCIHFLQQRKPAILPCLQGMEATYVVTVDDIECAYFDKVENLRNFGAQNKESVAELVWAFFDYWAFRHDYANAVISVRTGSIISKREKDWTRRIGNDRHLICIEDPFEISHDLGRVVDKYSIKILREEFERAANIMQYDPDPCATLFEPYVPPS